MSVKSQKVSALYLQPFGNDTRKHQGGGALRPPARNRVKAWAMRNGVCELVATYQVVISMDTALTVTVIGSEKIG